MRWRDAVLDSLRAYHIRHGSRMIPRQQFIAEELTAIAAAVGSVGRTPEQTLSRILQELRDDGLVQFLGSGFYLLLDSAIDVSSEDFTDEAIDHAIRARRLTFVDIPTATALTQARQRRGQDRLRALSLDHYSRACAVCDVGDTTLLIASHILPWAEAPEYRGRLDNVICLCRFHDALFERGYWSLADDMTVLKRAHVRWRSVRLLLDQADTFRPPAEFPPAVEFIRAHRRKFGFA